MLFENRPVDFVCLKIKMLKLLVCLLFVQVAFGIIPLTIKAAPKKADPKFDMCAFCVDFMDNAIDQLLNIILNGGVIGTCAALCEQLPNSVEQIACDLICDYVGIEAFIDFIDYEDPDPIFICEEFSMCAVVENGAVNITKTVISPAKGSQGTEFTLGIFYTVINATGPGLLTVFVQPPSDFPMGDGEFTEGQTPGTYSISWKLNTQPTEQESFDPGVYQVQMAVCEGDCTGQHRWSGVYASVTGSFTITG